VVWLVQDSAVLGLLGASGEARACIERLDPRGRVFAQRLGHIWGMNQGTAEDNNGFKRTVMIWR
jgi:hypothetical protein